MTVTARPMDDDAMIDLGGIREMFGLSCRQAAYKLTSRAGFPAPAGTAKLTGRTGPAGRVWPRAAVEEWKRLWDAERGVRAVRVGLAGSAGVGSDA